MQLKRITKDNFEVCLSLSVKPEQQSFVCSNAESLARAYAYYNRVTPLGIYVDDEMIGFILLRYHAAHQTYFLWEFMIDQKHQDKGYGKQALTLVVEWVKRDERTKGIVTTYKMGNEKAKHLYETFGFKHLSEVSAQREVDLILNF